MHHKQLFGENIMDQEMKSLSIEKEIELINYIIEMAVEHGGDFGGSYCSNWYSLEESIGEWLYAKGLDDSYAACKEPCNDYIVPIKKINIKDYLNDDTIWFCYVSSYQLDEIKADGLTDTRKGVHKEIFRSKGLPTHLDWNYRNMYVGIIDIQAALTEGKSSFFLAETRWGSNTYESFFVDYIPANCFTIIKTEYQE